MIHRPHFFHLSDQAQLNIHGNCCFLILESGLYLVAFSYADLMSALDQFLLVVSYPSYFFCLLSCFDFDLIPLCLIFHLSLDWFLLSRMKNSSCCFANILLSLSENALQSFYVLIKLNSIIDGALSSFMNVFCVSGGSSFQWLGWARKSVVFRLVVRIKNHRFFELVSQCLSKSWSLSESNCLSDSCSELSPH